MKIPVTQEMVEIGLSKDSEGINSETMDTLDVPETDNLEGETSDSDEGG